ncbi:glycoside hydrolase family 16 protein [Moniliophthora roreri]|nr:glycoside hydrolase family 16 protein [Moniliophthora roreri]
MVWTTAYISAVFLVILPVLGAYYDQTDSYAGSQFLQWFTVVGIADPTHGRVNYVGPWTAQAENLTFATDDTFILRADYKSKLGTTGPGRNSVRLHSRKLYTEAVIIFNIRHMPEGCGTWPAVWTVGSNWPKNGEVDIVEGVNSERMNMMHLHTSSSTWSSALSYPHPLTSHVDCTMPLNRTQTGITDATNCDTSVNYNEGCGAYDTNPRSFGPGFNANGGGWYAMERTETEIKIWFWERNSTNVPQQVSCGETAIDTETWGIPAAYFPSTSNCTISEKFGPHRIIINRGDLAGQVDVYRRSGCPGTCTSFVENNPEAFKNAYFDFAWLKVYEPSQY